MPPSASGSIEHPQGRFGVIGVDLAVDASHIDSGD